MRIKLVGTDYVYTDPFLIVGRVRRPIMGEEHLIEYQQKGWIESYVKNTTLFGSARYNVYDIVLGKNVFIEGGVAR